MANIQEDEKELGGPQFSPPLYQQRYAAALEVARRIQAKKVVDMGCAECKLLRQLKKEPYIEELVGVDIDRLLLNVHRGMVYPLTTDFLHPRKKPLHLALMHGSIADPDSRLVNFDLLLCIEVVEHLDPPVLDAVPQAIFGVLRPKVIVMTTPNSEFNVLFPGFSGYRHPDHRFEWTRGQFQSWCDGIASCYGYTVEYSGVGRAPIGKEEVGFCSQMATFSQASQNDHTSHCVSIPYTIVAEAAHPYQTNPLSPEERLCSEVEYYLGVLLRQRREFVSVSSDTHVSISLSDLLQFPKVSSLCSSVSEIQCSLRRHSNSVQLDTSGACAVFPCDPSAIASSDLSSSDDGSEPDEHTSQRQTTSCCSLETEEDWDNC